MEYYFDDDAYYSENMPINGISGMWTLQNLEDFDRQSKWYEKKHSNELAAVRNNLKTFFDGLCIGGKIPNLMAAHRFLHREQAGVIAIDQKGGPKNLAQTRLYVYPDETTKTLYLITIGDKNNQPDDVQFSKEFVLSLREAQADGQSQTGTLDPPDG